ncbi:ABC transporter ATP-binding protein [Eilatimonas milleporae]|uniref:NitT/TauT family transport system ATP-binding protein n=1 Tax=Eilatimonas milleporae TaxID=911205 RepID=A0A3M0CXK5_9PROT|nr:ABC transporter ATP-binding protein [Eilatimonas milleporae]RMB08633.1 NitT/TauT family transport system ATP-binding protein [Eilatimonas milleporae]
MMTARGLAFSYGGTQVLHDVGLSVVPGEVVTLLGPSGCGKSTVLRLLAGLETPHSGVIERDRADPAGGTAFVFQRAALMPWASVLDNVRLPHRLSGRDGRADANAALEAVGLAGMGARYPHSLSGGQRMRVSIARALASGASLILMDEPFGALDEILRFRLNDLMLTLVAERSLGVVFVTHSLFEAAYLSTRVHVIGGGRVVGTVEPALDRRVTGGQQRASTAFGTVVAALSTLLEQAA